MGITYGTKINQLLATTAPTGLLFADWLKKEGYSGQLQKIQGLRMADCIVQRSYVSHWRTFECLRCHSFIQQADGWLP